MKIMKVEFADTFFKSLKVIRWHNSFIYKSYDLFATDIPRFFKNIYNFRKVLWNYRWWDHTYTLETLYTSISIMEKNTSKYGHEIEITRNKKIAKMHRALEILKSQIDGDFIDRAEKVLGELPNRPWKFKDVGNGCSELINDDTADEKELRRKVYDLANELEKSEWIELWSILKGQSEEDYEKWLEENKDKFTQDEINNYDAHNEWNDGSGLNSWWD